MHGQGRGQGRGHGKGGKSRSRSRSRSSSHGKKKGQGQYGQAGFGGQGQYGQAGGQGQYNQYGGQGQYGQQSADKDQVLRNKIDEIYSRYDRDNTGFLDPSEFQAFFGELCQMLGKPPVTDYNQFI